MERRTEINAPHRSGADTIDPQGEKMKFNELSGQYELTESELIGIGIDLRSRLASRRAVNPDNIICSVLSRTSEMVYAYIHQFSPHNAKQDEVFVKYESARRILYRALKSQVTHILNVGDLSLSARPEERENAMNEVTKQILGEVIPEIRCSIVCGRV